MASPTSRSSGWCIGGKWEERARNASPSAAVPCDAESYLVRQKDCSVRVPGPVRSVLMASPTRFREGQKLKTEPETLTKVTTKYRHLTDRFVVIFLPLQGRTPSMAENSDLLSRIDFGNEAGDDVDPEELMEYFVEQQSFAKFLERRRKLLVASARKGVGKSALLKWTAHKIQSRDPEALVISVRGADLTRASFNLTSPLTNANEHTRDWMVRLCSHQ